jgi:hypothetical protein
VCETLNTLQSYWLASEGQRMQRDDQDDDDTDEDDTDDSASSSSSSKLVAVYGVLVGVTFACLCLRAVLFSSFIARSASSLHAQALRGVLRSPMSFFDTVAKQTFLLLLVIYLLVVEAHLLTHPSPTSSVETVYFLGYLS